MRVVDDVTELIGETPMVRINKLTKPGDATVYAKLEWYNSGGSIKDRLALYMFEYAESAGRLSRENALLEATSGNTGIALAMIAAAKGYRLTLVMPESVSLERRSIIRAYGAELLLSPGSKGTGGAIELKQSLLKQHPRKYIDLDQFQDPANILAHYQTTGREILEQAPGDLAAVVIGVGTAGTGVGVSMRVKQHRPEVQIIGVTPRFGTTIQGLRNPSEPFPTQLFRSKWFDELVELGEEEKVETFRAARDAARREGLLIGMSAGAILYVALRKANGLGGGKTVVAVLPDGGERYLSTPLYGES
ncbi:MAG TPA: PLP-dependent cysteine synthase family protein [Nitrososphaerales archaeon]|nr:PLP-dependent cysteine synthase family protein [Nitrososphaerales archaeon]